MKKPRKIRAKSKGSSITRESARKAASIVQSAKNQDYKKSYDTAFKKQEETKMKKIINFIKEKKDKVIAIGIGIIFLFVMIGLFNTSDENKFSSMEGFVPSTNVSERTDERDAFEERQSLIARISYGIPISTYKISSNSLWQEAVYINTNSGHEFRTEYYIFSNQNHSNGYVLIREVSEEYTDGDDENVIYGKLITIPEAQFPEIYIAMVDSGIQNIILEIRSAGNYTNIDWKVMLFDAPKEFKSLFRTAEAIIATKLKVGETFTGADLVETAIRMSNRQHGLSR